MDDDNYMYLSNPDQVEEELSKQSEFLFSAKVRAPGGKYSHKKTQKLREVIEGGVKKIILDIATNESNIEKTVKSYTTVDGVLACRKKAAFFSADSSPSLIGRMDIQFEEGAPYAFEIIGDDDDDDLTAKSISSEKVKLWLRSHGVRNVDNEVKNNAIPEYCNNLNKKGGKKRSKRRYKSKRKNNTKRRRNSVKKNNKRNKSRRKY